MEPSATTRTLAAERRRLIDELETVRDGLADAIREDARQGVRQVELVKTTGYTREQIRRIVAGRTT